MELEQEIMQIITNGGDARANSIKAIREARSGEITKAEALLNKAKDSLNIAHQVQTQLIQAEVRGVQTAISLLMVHAQDHLMNALTIKELAIEMVEESKCRIQLENQLKGEDKAE
ncbi:PTS lactose/cellobiose transporter subunit IIA [Amphibacillus cookii]|uniref:PTS lactose/cellobiose transporter subunit IIA n=1 Tax=Amphibacillus cookii TaxID=767787 RepID=UPI0019590589|nr:PTS lactose/cellobiose transporter subunit IIA [Amphibacillus cookii]MBM7539950.1 PTS system cellobiose-specific IIA component [Amphibacillus cookii]